MSVNLLELAKGYVTKEVVSKAASFVGESESATQSGFDHILPALMGGILSKGSDKTGANELFDLVSKPELGGGLLNNVTDLFSGTSTSNEAMNVGGNLLRVAMGDRLGAVTDIISSASGMKSGSSSSLMKLALPMVLSVIGKKVKTDGLGLDGFASLLGGQRDFVKEASPGTLWDGLLGVFGVGGLTAAASDAVSGVADAATEMVSSTTEAVSDAAKGATQAVGSAAKKVTGGGDQNDKNGGGGFGRFMPFILLLAVLFLAFWLFRNCQDDVKNAGKKVAETTSSVVDSTQSAIKEGVNKAGNALDLSRNEIYKFLGGDRPEGEYDAATDRFVYEAGEMQEIELPDGVKLNVGKFSGENFLYQLINNDNFKVDEEDASKGWFTLDGVFFQTGSSTLDASSGARLDNVAKILNAYPNVGLKFGGYTDNVGNPDSNLTLSNSRALAALNFVASKGVDKARLSSEGFGQQFPVCPANDTDACKAQNRRVDVRLTKK